MTKSLQVNLPHLHAGQHSVAHDSARFKVLACGRRWGKTRLASTLCVAEALRGGHAWWVAPTYPMSNVGWRLLKGMALQVPGVTARESERMLAFPGGGWVQVRSGDNPDSLRGEGLDFVAVDECAFLTEPVWTEALRPALADRKGGAMFISTPSGRNWYWHLWQRGAMDASGEWKSWQMPSATNPYLETTEIEAARNSLPERTFQQEFLAEFLEGEGAVFRNIAACLHAPTTTPEAHEGHRIVLGADWAKQADFSAFSVFCADCNAEVALDRFNQIDYHVQRQRLAALCERWDVCHVETETNSIGEPIFEELRREGLPVVGFQTTPTSKPPLIESLALAFEREEAQWLDIAVATFELEAYERKVSVATNKSQYSAPEGGHDDTVMARALAWRAATAGEFQVTENPFYA